MGLDQHLANRGVGAVHAGGTGHGAADLGGRQEPVRRSRDRESHVGSAALLPRAGAARLDGGRVSRTGNLVPCQDSCCCVTESPTGTPRTVVTATAL